MLYGFHKTYSIHAYNHITKPVEIPLDRLAVDTGESLAPLKNAVHYPFRQKEIVQPDIDNQSLEYSQIDGFADPLTPEDFPKTLYFGSPIGGI